MRASANPGRVAGLLYLLLMAAPLRLIYIPAKLFVAGDATATAGNIVAHETLFRLGMASDLVVGVALVFVVLAFYRLFKGVDRTLAVQVVLLGGVLPGCIYFLNVANDGIALLLARGEPFLDAFDAPQRDALAMLFLRLHAQVVGAAELLWGLWLLPLGWLVYRSRFVPRFIGIWLLANGVAYVAACAVGLLAPYYTPILSRLSIPAMLGEVVLMLWLLIRGVSAQAVADREMEHRSHARVDGG